MILPRPRKDEKSGEREKRRNPMRKTNFRKPITAIAAGASGLVAIALVFTKIAIWVASGIVTLSAATMASGQQASVAAAQAPRPESAIVESAEKYRQAVLHQDATSVIALFREDAIEMPPFQPPITGRAAIARFYDGSFRGPTKVTSFTFSHGEVHADGDTAYDVGTYKRSMATPAGPVEASGPYVAILKRTDGAWRIAYLIYNCDCPPPQSR